MDIYVLTGKISTSQNTTATPFTSAIQHNSLLINYNECYVFTYGLTCWESFSYSAWLGV